MYKRQVSAVVAAVLVLVVSSMSGWVAVAVVTLLPLASGACLAFSWRDVQGQEATAEHWGVFEQRAYNDARDRAQRNPFGTLRAMGRGGLGVMVACLFVCVEGTFYAVPDKTSWPFQFVFVVSIAFMVVVAVASTMGPRRIAMSFLYRWMCPVLVVGFASVVLFGPDVGGYCAYVAVSYTHLDVYKRQAILLTLGPCMKVSAKATGFDPAAAAAAA